MRIRAASIPTPFGVGVHEGPGQSGGNVRIGSDRIRSKGVESTCRGGRAMDGIKIRVTAQELSAGRESMLAVCYGNQSAI